MWNANCDSDRPRSKRELLQDLDTWERTQGGKASSAHGTVSAVMRKDFDGTGWANKNKEEFSRLIADAKRLKSNPATATNSPKDEESPHEDATKPVLNSDESSISPFVQPRSQRQPQHNDTTPATANPYADNPGALSSMQEQVAATNAGHQSTPTDNAGFRSSDPRMAALQTQKSNGDASHTRSAPTAGSRNPSDNSHPVDVTRGPPALINGKHLDRGHEAPPPRMAGGEKGEEHHQQAFLREKTDAAAACNWPAHMHRSPGRKIPMFAVPEEPITDVDGDGPTV